MTSTPRTPAPPRSFGQRRARARLEDFRAAVEAYPWEPITGGLPVTVSIGVADAHPASTQSTLLAEADEHLHAAKRAGRNRIVAGAQRPES